MYTMQEKEMTLMVHCLRTWRHYLLGSKFIRVNLPILIDLKETSRTVKEGLQCDTLA